MAWWTWFAGPPRGGGGAQLGKIANKPMINCSRAFRPIFRVLWANLPTSGVGIFFLRESELVGLDKSASESVLGVHPGF